MEETLESVLLDLGGPDVGGTLCGSRHALSLAVEASGRPEPCPSAGITLYVQMKVKPLTLK